MITTIAFDFVGVFLKENDLALDPVEQILERMFGVINNDEDYFIWAQKETGLTEKEIEKKTVHIIENLYEIREPEIFQKLPKLKISSATNHLSYMDIWFKKKDIAKHFNYFVNSALIGAQKPEANFYRILIDTVNELTENILFIDDNELNCIAAQEAGLKVIHYKKDKQLSEVIMQELNKDLVNCNRHN